MGLAAIPSIGFGFSAGRSMNLYLLLAFAFGAVTAVADAPIARASVILSRADGEGSQAARKEILRCAEHDANVVSLRTGALSVPLAIRFDAPLTGASSPRAPATIG